MKIIATILTLSFWLFISMANAASITIKVIPKGEILAADWNLSVELPKSEPIELDKSTRTKTGDKITYSRTIEVNAKDLAAAISKKNIQNIEISALVYMNPEKRGQYKKFKCEIKHVKVKKAKVVDITNRPEDSDSPEFADKADDNDKFELSALHPELNIILYSTYCTAEI